jgi:hypothetical protein
MYSEGQKFILDTGGRARRKEVTRKTKNWVDNFKLDLRENGWSGMEGIHLAQDRDQCRALVNTVMNFRFP